jgi:hypothetical protein
MEAPTGMNSSGLSKRPRFDDALIGQLEAIPEFIAVAPFRMRKRWDLRR